jgi:hypothetical protein
MFFYYVNKKTTKLKTEITQSKLERKHTHTKLYTEEIFVG